MSFIKESRLAYKKVQEAEDHEISMARGELEAIADKATQLASMLQGKSDNGNPLEAWVQSKITKAKDYINSVSDYMMYNPKINESYELEETTFEKIYQMQQDGKTADDIAKELKLKPDLVKKVLGESKIISEGLSDAQIAQLKKEYEPLKGKTITTSQYQQLKNILFKLQDGDLEKLQKQNIPFASTGAGSILRVRKSPVKITNVTVPGLEGMAEENEYVAIHVKKGETSVTANSSYEAAKKASEKFGLKNTAGVTVYLTKKDGKEIIHKATEEAELQEKPSIKQFVIFTSDKGTTHKEFSAYSEPELNKQIGDYLKQNPGYKVLKKEPVASIKETFKDNIVKKLVKPIQDFNKKKEEPKKEAVDNPYAIGMAAAMKATGDTPPLKKSTITKAHKIADKVKEEVEKMSEEKSLFDDNHPNGGQGKSISEIEQMLKKEIQKGNFIGSNSYTVIEPGLTHFKQDQTITHKELLNNIKRYGANQFATLPDATFGEEVKITESHFSIGQHVIFKGPKNPITPIKAQIIKLEPPYTGAYYQIKKADGETTYASPDQLELDEACWTGYKQVGLKKKGKRMVPNCVPEERRLYIESIVAVKNKAEKSGMPYSILKQVYDRGMAAWKGGHRPGATQVQWALARVNSFVTKSSGTWGGADSDLAKKVKG